MKKWKQAISICMTCALLAGTMVGYVQTVKAEAMEKTSAGVEGQLTMEDLIAVNGGKETIHIHNDRVTFVDGTCSETSVTGAEDAAKVVDSMMTLIGADDRTDFVLWRTVTDPLGNIYYIFQQMFGDTTVLGGAVKVITDADGKMIGLSSSVESNMPDVKTGDGVTAEEAEKIVMDKEFEATGRTLEILSQFTDTVILPSEMKIDLENADTISRFVWVVYSNNPTGNVSSSSDLPYLAHYVSMEGEYLYNMPAIAPDDEAGRTGFDSSYIFEFMEPADYTGYVDMSDGTEKEITVTVMRDKRTGMYYLGNIERRILVGECYDFLYNDGQVVLEYSPDNMEWDQVGLLSLYNYCRAYDYYREIGWFGADGEQTPILILNNYCDDHFNGINNACYMGKYYGMQCFGASNINDCSQCLDIIAHEFTHCVTHTVMTYSSYMNDYGAINEGMSDCQGKNCEMMAGDVDPDNWVIGSHSIRHIRSMSDPHLYNQPEFSWDLHYINNVKTPSPSNDHGGVHANSSLLNRISCLLVSQGGMSLEEARIFWFITDLAMVPKTDYVQLEELLTWVLKTAGMQQYADALQNALEQTRLADKELPEDFGDDRALITLSLPDTEAFDTGNWSMMLVSVKMDDVINRVTTRVSELMNQDYSSLPEVLKKALEEEKAEAGKKQEFELSTESVEEFITSLLDTLTKPSEEKEEEKLQKEAEKQAKKELFLSAVTNWLQEELNQLIFYSKGMAGPDGSTINMVVRPGRTIPVMQHATYPEGSEVPDQLVSSVYIGGKWYSVNASGLMQEKKQGTFDKNDNEAKDLREQIIQDVLGEDLENVQDTRSLDDVLNLFTIEIKGGEKLTLSSNGLEDVVIPDPTPAEEKTYGTLKPGKKSRPKLPTEIEVLKGIEETGAGTLDEAA